MPSHPASAIALWNSNGKPPSVSLLSQYASSKRPHSRATAARISSCPAVSAKDISTSRVAPRPLKPPAAALAERLVELAAVGRLRRGAHSLVEKLGVLADENAPSLRLDAIEDDGRRLGRRRWRVLTEAFFEFQHPSPDLIVGIGGGVDTLRGKPSAGRGYVDCGFAPLQNFARIGRNVGADMAGHDHRAFDVPRIERQVGDQSFCEALDREFCGTIGGVRPVGAERGPEAVDAAGVDDVAFIRVPQQRQKGPRAVIYAVPAHTERLFPFGAVAIDKTGIVEEKMDMVGVEIAVHGSGK